MSELNRFKTNPKNIKRKLQEDAFFKMLFMACAILSSMMIVIIVVFIMMKGLLPFLPGYKYGTQNFIKFFFGSVWRQDQGIYGVGFIILNTLFTGFLALMIAFPLSVLTALFVAKIAPKPIATFMQTIIELLSSIPSVVYGVFAAGSIVLFVKNLALMFGVTTAGGNSMMAVVILLALMILPTITTIAITAIRAVSVDLEQASLALGATRTQTNFKIVLSAAKSGIFAGAILGLGRAFGEATAVSMVAGNKLFGPTYNLFDITRTMTSTILAGLKETVGLDYDVRFTVGIVLMIVILLSNLSINFVKNRIGRTS
ncbi:MAG: phosphate ABC transporter permease subunit PstC [Erysipelotrichales bacterium]|nr:MAG: phosphate ABC transporter permease subunit PstC [Erysipelotrichales bacterium]